MRFNLNLKLEHLINAHASQPLPPNCSEYHQIQLEVMALQKMKVPVPITVTREKTTQTWLSNTTLSMQWRKTWSEIVQANLSTSLASTAAHMSHLTTMQTCKTTNKKIQKSHTHKCSLWGLREQLLPDMLQIYCWTKLLVAVCLQHCQPTRSHVHSFIYPQCCALCMHSPSKKQNVRIVTAFMKLQTKTTLSCTRNTHTRASITWQCVDTCPRHKVCKTVSMRQRHSRMNKNPARRKMECRQCVHKLLHSPTTNDDCGRFAYKAAASQQKESASATKVHAHDTCVERYYRKNECERASNIHGKCMYIYKANTNTSTSIRTTNTHACKNQPKLHNNTHNFQSSTVAAQ